MQVSGTRVGQTRGHGAEVDKRTFESPIPPGAGNPAELFGVVAKEGLRPPLRLTARRVVIRSSKRFDGQGCNCYLKTHE